MHDGPIAERHAAGVATRSCQRTIRRRREVGRIFAVRFLGRFGMFSDFVSIAWRGTLAISVLLVALQATGLLH